MAQLSGGWMLKGRSSATAVFVFYILGSSIAQRSFHITTQDGLNTNVTTQLLRDRDDNMWIGSYNGLHKHEGNSILLYNRTDIDGYSMSSGEIYTLCEDNQGFIWAGTANGLDRIDPVSGKISNFFLASTSGASTFIGYIYAVFQDLEGTIWACTDAAIFRVDPQTGTYTEIPSVKDSTGIPNSVTGYVTGVGDERGFWIQVSSGLVFYEYASGLFYHRFHNPKGKAVFNLAQPSIGANGGLCLDSLGNLYFVANHSHLYRYHLQTESLDSVAIPFPPEAWKCCVSMALDRYGNVWLGTRKGGVLIYHTKNNTWTSLRYAERNSLIGSNYIHSLCEDYLGRMWVTGDNGVDIIEYADQSIRIDPLSNRSDFVRLEYENGTMSIDSEHNVYMPFSRGGLIVSNLDSHIIRPFERPEDVRRISYIYSPGQDEHWLADQNGLLSVTFQNDKLLVAPLHAPFEPLLRRTPGSIMWIYSDNAESWYFKKSNGMLYHYTGGDTLEAIRSHGYMKQICLSADRSALWYVLPDLNIAKRNLQSGVTQHFNIQRHFVGTNFSYAHPRDLIEDTSGGLWISSVNGAIRYDYTHDSLKIYTQSDGLSHGFNFAFAMDQQHALWTLNLGGIDVFDPQQDEFRNVYSLESGKYLDAFGSALTTQDGRLLFLSGSTLYTIDPGTLAHRETLPLHFRMQEMRVNEEVIDLRNSSAPMHFRYNQNRLSFRFGVQAFDRPEQIRFSYRLFGSHNDWIELGNRNELSLQSVLPGKYRLEIRADANDILSNNALAIAFTILPPFYATWWFRILAILTILSFGFAIMQSRIQNINRKSRIKQQLTELESKALRAQMNPHFVFNCLNAIQECVVTGKIEEAYMYLSKFSRLLRLVLEHSDLSEITLHQELEILDLYVTLEKLRFRDSLDFSLHVDEDVEIETILIPPMLVQPHMRTRSGMVCAIAMTTGSSR